MDAGQKKTVTFALAFVMASGIATLHSQGSTPYTVPQPDTSPVPEEPSKTIFQPLDASLPEGNNESYTYTPERVEVTTPTIRPFNKSAGNFQDTYGLPPYLYEKYINGATWKEVSEEHRRNMREMENFRFSGDKFHFR